jgi:small-conductance mechanosensitive channel
MERLKTPGIRVVAARAGPASLLASLLLASRARAGELLPKLHDRVDDVLDLPLLHMGGVVVTLGGLIGAALVVAFALLASKLVQRALERFSGRTETLTRASVYTVSRIIHYALVVAATLYALSLIGIDTGRMTLAIGALGVGLGFGLQQIFNNFVSGLIILFERSLKVGDFVDLGNGVHGEVQEINIRATRITTNDNTDIIVPNSEFVAGRVVNWTLREVARRLRVPFSVAYGTDKELVKKAALEAAAEVPFTLSTDVRRCPQVWLVGFGDSGLKFELVVWLNSDAVSRPSAVFAAYNWAIETALCKYCIELPFPQRDLHLRSVFGLQGDDALSALVSRAPHTETPQQPTLTERERDELGRNDAAEDVRSAQAGETPVSD